MRKNIPKRPNTTIASAFNFRNGPRKAPLKVSKSPRGNLDGGSSILYPSTQVSKQMASNSMAPGNYVQVNRPKSEYRPRTAAQQTYALTKALIQKVGCQEIDSKCLNLPSDGTMLSNGLDEWTEDYIGLLEGSIDDNYMGFKSGSILSHIKLAEILRATSGLESPSTLRTAVSMQVLAQHIKKENPDKSIMLKTALNELLHAIYCIGESPKSNVEQGNVTPNNDIDRNKPYFQLFKNLKNSNEQLLQRNTQYRKRMDAIAHASRDRTMAMDTIMHRWKRKIKLFVFLQWKYLTLDEKDKNENTSTQFLKRTRRNKFKSAFQAWRHLAQETRNKEFKQQKLSLASAEEAEEQLRNKVDQLGEKLLRAQEEINTLKSINFQVVMVVADMVRRVEEETLD